jgi:hypothetical protein
MSEKVSNEKINELLKALSPEGEEAAIAYTKLQNSLVRFFQIKGDLDSLEAADLTLDRVALKISQETPIDDLTKYSFGVARLIFFERLRQSEKERKAADGFYADKISENIDENSDSFTHHRECFESLESEEKQLLKDYFADLPHSKQNENRSQVSVKYKISLSNLRLKVFRLRKRLEECVRNRLR